MKEKLKKAILNNNDLYDAVFSAQDINFNRNHSICYCLEKPPPFYSNLVTVSENWQPDEIFDLIEENFENENWNEWSIKDSFGVLDLHQFGFEKLFDATWFYLDAAQFSPVKNTLKLSYEIVRNGKALAQWMKVWDDVRLGSRIFQSAMLDNPNINFIAGYAGEKIITGCLVNKTADVFGISNFFAPDSEARYWSEIVEFIHDSIEFAGLVGYERKNSVEKLKTLGFEATGNLTVWIRNRASD